MISKINQLFHLHVDYPENRKYGNVGHVFKCPKCGKYIGYSKEHDRYIMLSKKDYDEHIRLFVEKEVKDDG